MEKITRLLRPLARYEWILFCGIALLNLIPALRQPFFPTVDGPAHMYNANLIRELLFGDSALLQEFYKFNPEIVPNWGGHFMLVVLSSLFSMATAGKVFMGLCLFLLPLSFRYCVRKINPSARGTTYLIFPFSYTFMLCMGFYNFFAGLTILFFTIGQILHYRERRIGVGAFLVLFVLIGMAYLSHLFIFLSLGLFLFFLCSLDLVRAFPQPAQRKASFKKAMLFLLASVVPLLLTLRYFKRSGGGGEKIYLLKTELLQWITNGRSLICYNVEEEVLQTTTIFLVLMVLFSVALYLRFQGAFPSKGKENDSWRSLLGEIRFQDIFLVLTVVFIVAYFRLPDSDISAGFISTRLNLMLFLFLILWISSFRYPKWMMGISIVLILFSQYKLLKAHNRVFADLNQEITEIMTIEPLVRENSIVLPLNYSGNWLTTHNSNYLGLHKPLVILENYECNNSYFPLSWNSDEGMLNLAHANWSNLEEILTNTPEKTFQRIDYIFVQGKKAFPDSSRANALQQFSIKKETENFLLLERK